MRRRKMARTGKKPAYCGSGADGSGADGSGASGKDGDGYAVAGGAGAPVASVMGLTQGELTATPMADAASVTGAAQPVAVSVRNPAGRTSSSLTRRAGYRLRAVLGAALGQALEARREPVRPRFVFRPRSARPRSPSAIRAKFPRRLPRRAAGGNGAGRECPRAVADSGKRGCGGEPVSGRRRAVRLPDAARWRRTRAASAKLHAGRQLLRL